MSDIISFQESPAESHLSKSYGAAVRLLSSISYRRREKLGDIYMELWPPIVLGQISFLYDSLGRAVAFATWAFLTEEVEQLFLGTHDYRLDISEWNEGDRLWIMNFFSPYGNARDLCKKLLHIHHKNHFHIKGLRSYSCGRPRRLVCLRINKFIN